MMLAASAPTAKMPLEARPKAVLFDLLTALMDSWTLWDSIAENLEDGRRWRAEYLKITYAEGRYRALRSCEGA
jgi:2-haloacid dehalogenase